MVRAWHLHVQGPQQPGLLEVALFPERPIWPLSTGSTWAWCPKLLSQGQEQVGAQERTGVLLELTPPSVVQRLDIVMSRDWRASGPKCSHPELEIGFSSERPQSRISQHPSFT